MDLKNPNPKNFHIDTSTMDYDFYNTPGIKISKSIVLVKIEADNKEPTLLPGDVVICQKSYKHTFEPKESAAVILYKKGCIAQRLHKHNMKNYFLLSNDNPSYQFWEEIEKKNTLQLLIIYGKQRVDTMNESLEYLKTETSKITKKFNKLIN